MIQDSIARNSYPPSLEAVAGVMLVLYTLSLAVMQPGLRLFGYAIQGSEAIFPIFFFSAMLLVVWDRRRMANFPLLVPLSLYLLAFLLAVLFSQERWLSTTKYIGVVYLVMLAATVPVVVRNRRWLRYITLAFIAAAVLVGTIGTITVIVFYFDRDSQLIAPYLHHYGSLPVGNYPRVESTFIYPAMLCNYLTVGAMLALGANEKGWLNNRLTIAALLPISVTAFFTFTPGFGGAVLAVLIWAGLKFRNLGHRVWGWLAIAFGMLVGFTSLIVSAITLRQIPTSPYRFSILGTSIDPTQRFLTWEGSLQTFLEYPLFGKGIGTSAAQVHFLAPSGQNQMLIDAHNTFLNVAATAGLAGVAALVYLIVRVTRLGKGSGISTKPITVALIIAFLSAFVFQGLTGSYEDARHLWLLIGLIPAAASIETEQD